MSTASRNCGTTGGTCGGVATHHSAPGANGRTRGHYDPRADRQLGRPNWALPKSLPQATNAAPPRKRVLAPAMRGPQRAPAAKARMRRAPCAFFPIGLRGRLLRHSLPPPPISARGKPHGRKPP